MMTNVPIQRCFMESPLQMKFCLLPRSIVQSLPFPQNRSQMMMQRNRYRTLTNILSCKDSGWGHTQKEK